MTVTNGIERGQEMRSDLRFDLDAAEVAAQQFLAALGVDLSDQATTETPARMARAYSEMLSARAFDLTTFPNTDGYDQLVVLRDIPFASVCKHHFLPFIGKADVGYLPGERIIGVSKLARVVEWYACRPQFQERMTKQIADWLHESLAPKGVGVVVRAEHMCTRLRGVEVIGASMLTSALHGLFLDDASARDEFLALSRSSERARL